MSYARIESFILDEVDGEALAGLAVEGLEVLLICADRHLTDSAVLNDSLAILLSPPAPEVGGVQHGKSGVIVGYVSYTRPAYDDLVEEVRAAGLLPARLDWSYKRGIELSIERS